ncbi:MAG: hypothetical protein CMC55_08955 [Flavobacteriaceae bacterium]|uniref:hypothetical protein n=1 Tax=Bizionia echini TaxID=649333 RepID=UPI000C902F44|nr:hypothetical protein [Flavobacteriaceae bacterium]|tara:strand:- start:275 stop:523 length:249 start_codon:yes stop_codon:yes gene_type:complete
MLKNILNLEGISVLNKEQQKLVTGGLTDGGGPGNPFQGNYALRCNSGVMITNCPDNSAATGATACANQGGYSGTWICVGNGC